MTGSSRNALPDVWEWSGGPPRCPSCWKALPGVRECSKGPPRRAEVVGRPSRMSGSGRVADPDVQEWSGGPFK